MTEIEKKCPVDPHASKYAESTCGKTEKAIENFCNAFPDEKGKKDCIELATKVLKGEIDGKSARDQLSKRYGDDAVKTAQKSAKL